MAGPTCPGHYTCVDASCAAFQTCGSGSTCQGVATCDISPTCGGQATCTQAASCDAVPTCDGSPTCALAFTCSGWPTCQPPPQAGIVDTEYVRFPYWVDSLRAQDNDGDSQVSEIGKSRPQDRKYILKMLCNRPLAMECACNCHADAVCDGVISALDVVKIVNVAFRGSTPATEYCDPCP